MEILFYFLLAPIPGMLLGALLYRWWTAMDQSLPMLPPPHKHRRTLEGERLP